METTASSSNQKRRRQKCIRSIGVLSISFFYLYAIVLVLLFSNPRTDAFIPIKDVCNQKGWLMRSELKNVECSGHENAPNEKEIAPRTPKVKQQRFAQSQYTKPKASLPKSRLVTKSTSSSSSNISQQRRRNSSRTERNGNVPGKPSIEDLEQRLSQKFGTDAARWTSGEYDDDDDFDEEEEEINVIVSVPARPVRDPWFQSDSSAISLSSDTSAEDSAVRKVSVPITPPSSKGSTTSSFSKSSESPLAAFGRRQAPEVPSTPELLVPGRVMQITQPPSTREGSLPIKEPTKEDPSARTAYRPVLDANGRPMLLTLGQAQFLFQGSLTADDSSELDITRTSAKPSSSWQDLGITDAQLLRNLADMGCTTPLPAQRTAVPRIGSGDTDVVVGTYTGSGKTLAVMVPLIQRLLSSTSLEKDSKNFVRLIVCAPGRELASQIASVTRELVQNLELSVMLAIGGTTFSRNVEQIRRRKPDIVVGTPGRLAELVVGASGSLRGRLAVQQVQALVLDEFDALLSYTPHADPVRALVGSLKRARGASLQSILCSATAVDMLNQKSWEENFLRPGFVWAMADPEDELVTSRGDAFTNTIRVSRTVMHGVVHVPQKRFALETLRRILHTEPFPQQILIFVADARKVDICVEKLAQVGVLAAPLHGDSDKMDRAEISQALREGTVGMVVATEMAARGLDAPLLTHVINMDLPTDAAHYAHRAGRCGRGGRPGVVINLTTSPQERNVPMKFAKQLGIPMYTVEVKNSKLNVMEDVVLPLSESD